MRREPCARAYVSRRNAAECRSTPTLDRMKPLARIGCPRCPGTLSRTLLNPRWPGYEMEFPPYLVPVLRICAVVAVVGFGLAFIHVALSALALMAIGYWVWWQYYCALQCDACGKYFISGQFAGNRGRRVAWSSADTRVQFKRVALAATLFLVLFVPLFYLENVLHSRCQADCSLGGLRGEAELIGLKCKCVK